MGKDHEKQSFTFKNMELKKQWKSLLLFNMNIITIIKSIMQANNWDVMDMTRLFERGFYQCHKMLLVRLWR